MVHQLRPSDSVKLTQAQAELDRRWNCIKIKVDSRPDTSLRADETLCTHVYHSAAADGGGGGGGGIVASTNTNNINEELDNLMDISIEIASNKRMKKDNIKPFRLTFKDKDLEKKVCMRVCDYMRVGRSRESLCRTSQII